MTRLADDRLAYSRAVAANHADALRIFSGDLVDARPTTTIIEHFAALEQAQIRLGRPLTFAETMVDVVAIDRDLAEGKARLAAAIDAEKRRAIKRGLAGHSVRMNVTPEMRAALAALYRAGRSHARNEIEGLLGNVLADREFGAVEVPHSLLVRLATLLVTFSAKVNGRLTVAVGEEAISGELGDIGTTAVARAVARVPGALDVASRLVSSALFAGVGDVYADAAGLFAAWQYSAVSDSATCDVCGSADGTEYATWDDAMVELPDGGPNPDCDGDGRCRCRVVPVA